MKSVYSTRQAAKKLKISLITLQRHIASETFSVPSLQRVGGIRIRLWSDRHIRIAREALAGIKPGRKKKESL